MNRKPISKVCVIGLGYVGLPLSLEFVKGGLDVVGIDIDETKVRQIQAGRSYVLDVADAALAEAVAEGALTATTDFAALQDADAACICVPTPLRKSMDPDISHIVAAVEDLARFLRPGMLVVLESTTYPGTTEELLLPKLSESGLNAGEGFYLAFSPERVDPGNQRHTIRNTPKVVGGITEACAARAAELYRHAAEEVVVVSNARVAEMVKLLENTFRAVNIGLVNELAIMCDRLDVDVWEVIDAAATKPFGYMRFYPGPGLGGHCIPIDPLYLSWKLKDAKYTAQFIELADKINSSMPEYVVEKAADALNRARKSVNGSSVLVLGVAYKKDVSDTRESPALDIISLLESRGASVAYADPHVPSIEVLGERIEARGAAEDVSGFDCVIIVCDHSAFDYKKILSQAKLVVDTRNATAGIDAPETCTLVKL